MEISISNPYWNQNMGCLSLSSFSCEIEEWSLGQKQLEEPKFIKQLGFQEQISVLSFLSMLQFGGVQYPT